jgi:hypothetical protein
MRTLILLSMLSVPAFAAKTELEPKATVPGQLLVCSASVTPSKEVQHGLCKPAAKLPQSFQSLGERKSK